MHDTLTIKGARLHNLKNVTVSFPKNKLVVLTGLSGSGKSTLAFDILHKEGQRQYMESMGMVTDYLSKPPIDGIEGLSPSISVDQHLSNRSPRSTVGTVTEVYTYLRVLFARIGCRPCPICGGDVPPASFVTNTDGASPFEFEGDTIKDASDMDDTGATMDITETTPCPHCGASVPELGMAHFSFNKPAGACPACTGLGTTVQPNLSRLLDPEHSIAEGGVLLWNEEQSAHYGEVLQNAGKYYGFEFDLTVPIKKLNSIQRDLLLYGVYGEPFRQHFPDVKPPSTVGKGNIEGIVTNVMRRYREYARNPDSRNELEALLVTQTCPDCNGDRLRPESRAVTINGQTIIDLSRLPLSELTVWLAALPDVLPIEAHPIITPILDDLNARVRRLVDVGAGYLTMLRASPTLSAGEAQRLRLASLIGSGLTGVLYVLDEPTIGLHQRDTQRLIKVLRQLRDLGNTVLVIEHDLEMVRAADYVIDMGPGAGILGGEVVAAGTPEEMAAADSATGRYMSGRDILPVSQRRQGNGKHLIVHGARENNLKDITVSFPLGMLIAVTGVSGSGKSSLMLDILDRAARRRFYNAGDLPGKHLAITGWQSLDKVITIDQSAIGRTPRSNAATYTDTFTSIRQVFAAQIPGLDARHFSFNVPGGRCERCQGAGTLMINMHFLPDVEVRCPVCHGRRFKREILDVKYRGYSIADVLDMTITEAAALFVDIPAAYSRLALMEDVGLGYLKLGQPATTLSGGEAQRVKLAKELSRKATGRTLYLLDEPTTGLHIADVANLLKVLHGLVDTNGHKASANTAIVIEHNLDVIRAADWIIDLGPEGGDAGGKIIAQGTPEDVARVAESQTGKFLRITN
ncbi:MAG: excinuclease ABC subunit UvrA [Anaerolineae bacterium]|nr:excinuclease ABC subunit UvrA [Anaerolineae bacterium]